MADGYISQIKTPDNKTYLLKDSEKTDEKVSQTSNSENKEFPIILKNTNNTTNETAGVKYAGGVTVNPDNETITAQEFKGNLNITNLIPISTKTYTTALYNTSTGANHYQNFMIVEPTDYNAIWIIHYRLMVTAAGHSDYTAYYDCSLSGRANTYYSYKFYNSFVNYPIYYHMYLRSNSASTPHEIGVRIASSYGADTVQKTIKVELLEQINCTATLLDSLKLYTSDLPSGYAGWVTFNATSNGLQETGDNDTTGRDYSHSGYGINGSNFRLPPYTIFGYDKNQKAQGISLYESGYASSTTAISTTRVYNTAGFAWEKGLWFSNSGTNFAPNANLDFSPAEFYYATDMRYTDNVYLNKTTASELGIVARKPLYFRGTIGNDGLFYLAPITVTHNNTNYQRVWTQDIPDSDDGYVYWFIGYAYYSSSYAASGYQVNLVTENKLYWFHNGRFQEYLPNAVKADSIPLSGITSADDLKAIEAISETTGLLKKTAANTWTLDTSDYVTSSGITSVTIGATSPVQSSTSTAQTGSSASTTISLKDAYGDTKNPYGAKAKNLVLAGPSSGSNAAPTFRALVAADIPDISGTYVKKVTSTDNAIARFDGTSGQIQNSGIIIDDNNNITAGSNRILNNTAAPGQGELLLTALGFKTGYPVYTDPTFLSGNNSVNVYNNSGGGTVTHTRGSYTTFEVPSPGTGSDSIIKIETTGTASPGCGGFILPINARANAQFIQIFRALVPAGRNLTTASNTMGTDFKDEWLTSRAGTGKWEWYARRVICGQEGTMSVGGHVYIDGAIPVTWYLASCNVYDITKTEYDGLKTRYTDAANLTSTINAIAYYTDTVGTFGSKASANGALYATSANGTLQWGTLPIAQGGTGKTTANDAANALISSLPTWTASPTADTYFIRRDTGGTSTFGQVKFSSIANITNGKITLGPYSITPVTSVNGHTGSSVSITAADLDLSKAMRFIGVATVAITDGSTTDPVISGYSTKTAGDVIIDKDSSREYVWSTTGKWEMLGFDASAKYEKTTSGNTFISKITQATDGTITADSRELDTSGTWSGNATTATTATNLANNPSIQPASNSNQITITAGGKTSSAYTIPYATSAGSATSATTATYIKCTDTRNTALNPTDLTAAQGIRFDFKAKGTINLTATDTYAGVMSFRPYASNTDWSGGNAHQLAFNSEGLHWRNGGASWGDWYQILDSSNTTTGTNNNATLTWNTTYTIAKINGTDIKFTTMTKPTYAFSDLTSHPTTLSDYGITNAVQYNGIDNDIGSSATAANAKSYWANNNKVPKGKVVFNYNSSGTEFTTLFSNNNNSYGSILRWGYQDTYIRILRAHPNQTTYSGWYTEDWEKISAGYADSAGTATSAGKWTTARNISISDSDGTNTGTAVSVDGSAAVTLKLPATIKANITGDGSALTNLNASNISSGTLNLARLGNQNANTVLAGPGSGNAAAPSFRALATADIPDLGSIYVKKNSELLTTNPFAPLSLTGPYISKIDNAFYAADKRWTVTGTNISSTIALFDGNYESNGIISAGKTATITIDFDPNHNNSAYFPGYPYGYILVSFYFTSGPSNVSARVYCNYNAHGIGWHNLSFSPINDNDSTHITYRSEHQGSYNISQLEITITAGSSDVRVTQIEMHLDRPSSALTPFLSKYNAETLYYNLTAPKFIGALQGNADTATKFNSTRKIELTGAVTGSATTDGSSGWTISTTVNHNHDDRYSIASGVITLGSNTITPVTSVNGHSGSSVSVTASDLGLASALKYIGTKSSLPTATDSTTYSTYNNGDVITVSAKEYAYVKGSNAAGSSWVELGDEGSYKLKQTAFTNSTGTADGTNTSTSFIYSFSQNENGVISDIKTRQLPTLTNVSYTTATDDNEYPILLKNSIGSDTTAAGVKFANTSGKMTTINPNTGIITAPGGISAGHLTITSTSAQSHLTFSRANWNYITMPENNSSVISIGYGTPGDNTTQRLVIYKTGTVRPGANGSQNLGDDTHKWNKVYGVNFYGTFHGTAASANQLNRISIANGSSLNNFIPDTDNGYLRYTWVNGTNAGDDDDSNNPGILNKPKGTNAFGLFTFKTADNWAGQIFVSTNNLPGIYWRNGLTASGSLVANWTPLANGNGSIYYGTCATAADVVEKEVVCKHYHTLKAGDIIVVTFTNSNTQAQPKLNVNNTGAVGVKMAYSGGIVDLGSTTQLSYTCTFIYNGTYWLIINQQNAIQIATASNQTNWRSILLSNSNDGDENFTPSANTLGRTYAAHNVKYQPSTGTLRAPIMKTPKVQIEYDHVNKAHIQWNDTDSSIDFIFD